MGRAYLTRPKGKVTSDKIAAGVIVTADIADSGVTTDKIADANVTMAKIANGSALSVVGRSANSAGVNASIAAANDAEVLRRSGTSIGFGTVAAAGLTDSILTGQKAAVLADSAVIGGIPVVHTVDVADGVTANIDVTLTYKTEITDVVVQKRAGAGGASDTITINNGATAITNAMDINVADKTVVRPTTIDDAQSTIAAAGTLRIVRTKASANNVACLVTIYGVRRT